MGLAGVLLLSFIRHVDRHGNNDTTGPMTGIPDRGRLSYCARVGGVEVVEATGKAGNPSSGARGALITGSR